MAKAKATPKAKKKVDRTSIFGDAHKELSAISTKYKALAVSQSGGTAQRLNKASIDIGRLAKLFI
jgi:hypothetical protein